MATMIHTGNTIDPGKVYELFEKHEEAIQKLSGEFATNLLKTLASKEGRKIDSEEAVFAFQYATVLFCQYMPVFAMRARIPQEEFDNMWTHIGKMVVTKGVELAERDISGEDWGEDK